MNYGFTIFTASISKKHYTICTTASTTFFSCLTCACEECSKEYLSLDSHAARTRQFFWKQTERFLYPFNITLSVLFPPFKARRRQYDWVWGETEKESERSAPGARVSSDLILEMDLCGCMEGIGVAFTATFSLPSPKLKGGEGWGQSKTPAWKPSTQRWKSASEVMVQKRNGKKYTAPSLNNGCGSFNGDKACLKNNFSILISFKKTLCIVKHYKSYVKDK